MQTVGYVPFTNAVLVRSRGGPSNGELVDVGKAHLRESGECSSGCRLQTADHLTSIEALGEPVMSQTLISYRVDTVYRHRKPGQPQHLLPRSIWLHLLIQWYVMPESALMYYEDLSDDFAEGAIRLC